MKVPTRHLALTRASELIHVTETLDVLGESPERLLARANFPMWHYSHADDLVPKHHIFELMDLAARHLGNPNFGLLVGQQTSLSSMGSLGSLIGQSLTTYHALRTGCRLIPLHNAGAELSLVEDGDVTWFCHTEFPVPEHGFWQKEQYVLMRMIDHVRAGAGASWLPAKVCLQARHAPGRELRDALGDPEIRLGKKTTAFAVPRWLLAQGRRAKVRCEVGDDLATKLQSTAPAADFEDALRQLTLTLLKAEGPPRVETMAEIAGLSVRSLQRRLAQLGLTHTDIVEQARYQAATGLLEDPDIRITDIGIDLGYADSAHFTRAFKRWAGVTPREYRNHRPTP